MFRCGLLQLCFLLLLSGSSAVLAAEPYEYAVTENGLFYYSPPTSSSWSSPATSELRCRNLQAEYRDPAGGRAVLVEECFSPRSPIAEYLAKTFDFDRSKWNRCQPLERLNGYLRLRCPRIFRDSLH